MIWGQNGWESDEETQNDYEDLGRIFQMMNRVPAGPTLFM